MAVLGTTTGKDSQHELVPGDSPDVRGHPGDLECTGNGKRSRKSVNRHIHMLRNQKEVIWRAALGTCRNSWTSGLVWLLSLINMLAKMP